MQKAARSALERIRSDEERACARIRPLLAYLREHVFDSDLNVSQLKLACGIRDNSIATLFNSTVGIPPAAYIADRRFETASNLLLDTRLPVWKIGKLVGYGSMQSFSRAFGRWSGQRPNAFRKTMGRSLPRRRRERSPASVARTRLAARRNRPRQEAGEAGGGLLLSRDEIEKIRAEEIWEVLSTRSWAEQRELVRHRLRFRSPALFHRLRRMSRVIGREDRQEGVRIARLALESLEAIDGPPEAEARLELHAQGWVWLANAQRLALEFSEAERSLACAERYLAGGLMGSLVGAELFSIQASLRFSQHRMAEALELQNRAVPLLRRWNDRKALASGLLLRAVVQHYLDDHQGAMQDLREALSALGPKPDPFLALCAHLTMCLSYLGLGEHRQAEAVLPAARTLGWQLDSGLVGAHLEWVEGQVAEALGTGSKARSYYLGARATFLELGESLHAALVSLDLAMLYARQGRTTEVLTLAVQILPTLSAADLRSESVVATKMLRDAVETRQLSEELLREVRRRISAMRRDPLIPIPKGG